VVGVSLDDSASHAQFAKKYGLPWRVREQARSHEGAGGLTSGRAFSPGAARRCRRPAGPA
jgi:hypothetical protein